MSCLEISALNYVNGNIEFIEQEIEIIQDYVLSLASFEMKEIIAATSLTLHGFKYKLMATIFSLLQVVIIYIMSTAVLFRSSKPESSLKKDKNKIVII